MNKGFASTIGILGGIGPAATAYAFDRLITICQTEHGSVHDDDFPHCIVTSFPLTAMDEFGYADTDEVREQLKQQLARSADSVKRAGAEIVYVPCNTLYRYENVLQDAGLEEVNIIETTAEYISGGDYVRVAVLGSRATRREGLYAAVLNAKGAIFNEISEDQQDMVDELIVAAMGGKELEICSKKLRALCDILLEDVDCVVLGCTELSVLARHTSIEAGGVIDAQEVVLRELLRRAR